MQFHVMICKLNKSGHV